MASLTHHALIAALGLTSAAVSLSAAENTRKTFTSAWEGRRVVLKRPLYSVVYDERSRVLPLIKRQQRVSGLTVARPDGGIYYQFDRLSGADQDIADADPNQVLTVARTQYQRNKHLDIGTSEDVDPLMLVRYEPGVVFTVKAIQFDRARIRLLFHHAGPDREPTFATALTIQWPVPLSKAFTEGSLVESVLQQFLEPQSAGGGTLPPASANVPVATDGVQALDEAIPVAVGGGVRPTPEVRVHVEELPLPRLTRGATHESRTAAVAGLTTATSLCRASDDPTYGVTPGNPIKTGGGGTQQMASREVAFLRALRGLSGQGLHFKRLGSFEHTDGAMLDLYQVEQDGVLRHLYVDAYRWEEPKAPTGWLCGIPFGLNPPGPGRVQVQRR